MFKVAFMIWYGKSWTYNRGSSGGGTPTRCFVAEREKFRNRCIVFPGRLFHLFTMYSIRGSEVFFSFLEWEPGADYGINTNFFSFPLDFHILCRPGIR